MYVTKKLSIYLSDIFCMVHLITLKKIKVTIGSKQSNKLKCICCPLFLIDLLLVFSG